MKNEKRKLKLTIVGLLLFVFICIGISYSVFTANVEETAKTETKVQALKMGLIYTGQSDIDEENMMPGDIFVKTFTVENITDKALWYNIYMEDITNDYSSDLVYTLYEVDSNYENVIRTVVSETRLPETTINNDNTKAYLKTRIDIEAQPKIQYYKMVVEYKYNQNEEQEVVTGKFEGTVGIDVETQGDDPTPPQPATKYTLTINPNGGTYNGQTTNTTVELEENATYTVLTPTREGYEFTGWTSTKENILSDNTLTMPDENVTLTANWELLSSGDAYKCRRATILHSETCNVSNNRYYCTSDGYDLGSIIRYGNETTTNGVLKTGDAFDCDVNGDGTYDQTTERFYYVSTKNNGIDTDPNIAVLIYYNDTISGVSSSSPSIWYETVDNSFGPTTARDNLPTTSQWSNVQLTQTIRDITDEEATVRVNNFSYEGYAARLLTYQELIPVCLDRPDNIFEEGSVNTKCKFLFENSIYSDYLKTSYGLWLETPYSSDNKYAYGVVSAYRNMYILDVNYPIFGARPVIEIPITAIDLNNPVREKYTLTIDPNGGTYNGSLSNIIENLEEGTIYTLNTPIKEGYEFAGWTSNINGIVDDNLLYMPSSNVVLTAQWIETRTLTIDPNGGTYGGNTLNTVEILHPGDTYTLENPTRDGYTFAGWSSEPTLALIDDTVSISLTDVTVTANWIELCSSTTAVSTCTGDNCNLCVRATCLHAEECERNTSSYSNQYCDYDHYSEDIVYGNKKITNGVVNTGDAFDCDVNGDGTYDPNTERFYYVSTKDNGISSNTSTAALVYYTNTIGGEPTTAGAAWYEPADDNTKGPVTARNNLPTTSQWTNVNLTTTTRDITDEETVIITPNFSYEGYAARLLTYQEAYKACNVKTEAHGMIELNKNCEFLMENTSYSNLRNLRGIWLESPSGWSNKDVWWITDDHRLFGFSESSGSSGELFGVRPTIEVQLDDMEITKDSHVHKTEHTLTINPNGGIYDNTTENILETLSIGETYILDVPTKEGFIFAGWSSDPSLSLIGNTVSISLTDVTVTANWKLDVCPVTSSSTCTGDNCKLCKRATCLHAEECNQYIDYACRLNGHSVREKIIYGNQTTTSGVLNTGDAFDCDVNGDGTYDSNTERFYFVSTITNGITNNSNAAVLIYYTNTVGGEPTTIGSAWDASAANSTHHGPVTARNNLPTTTQWSNVELTQPVRTITDGRGSNMYSNFSYEGYAARLLTYQEVNQGCYAGRSVGSTGGLSSKCEFLMENTRYSKKTNPTFGPWLENENVSGFTSAYHVESLSSRIASNDMVKPNDYGARPTIEVPLDNIDY